MDAEDKQKFKRVYGRGFRDGHKAAVKEINDQATEKEMTEIKFNAIYRGLTEQAKKVYQAVPITEPWSVPQIMHELSRTTGQKEHRIVSGCLNSLQDSGLIREASQGQWVRVEVRPKTVSVVKKLHPVTVQDTTPEHEPEKKEAMPPINLNPPPQKMDTNTTPLERIGRLSAQVLAIIQNMHQLAADIEATALEVEEQMEKIQKDGARLKHFQELLKLVVTDDKEMK